MHRLLILINASSVPYAIFGKQNNHESFLFVSLYIYVFYVAFRLKHKKGLKDHMKRHQSTEEPSVCSICSRTFPRKSSLNAHMRYMHATAKYKCTMCEKALKTSTDLKVSYLTLY